MYWSFKKNPRNKPIRRWLPIAAEKAAEEGWEFPCEVSAGQIEHITQV